MRKRGGGSIVVGLEADVSYLQHDLEGASHLSKPERARAFALIETHYFLNGGAVEAKFDIKIAY
ncbi:hypothetical protein [Bradyrhizobium sp. AUGA SZCCT0431]|uniref:hypothetical protein n=1 Tax=Bradyrhizobium sp. AUGA SZCCT0431 TaxID=2807674 RepID=UPI001BA6CF03|nr:hypothetical protein [Bradyrhizobium sp. AUGA SZCCT0431]MBR1147540.1 hypothetical protein [Bradyrhizobium sp. AUGA SZCCT0431]